MRRHIFLVWGVVLLLVGSGIVVVLLWPRSDGPVSLARCERVQVGMTLEEVEAVLGAPAGDYRTGAVEVVGQWPDDSFMMSGERPSRYERWQGDDGTFWVCFDEQDRVVTRRFMPGRRTLIDKLRAWLGF